MVDLQRRYVATIAWHNAPIWTIGLFLDESTAWEIAGVFLEALKAKYPGQTGEIIAVEPDWRHGSMPS